MSGQIVFVKDLPVLDDGGFFTEERFKEWYNMLVDFSGETINQLRDLTGNISGVLFEINTVLLKEVIYDAMIDLKKVVISKNNGINEPNPFKIASTLGYWFLRHKPIVFRASKDLDLDNIEFASGLSSEERKDIIVEIKHMNEIAMTNFLLRYIFNFDNEPVCRSKRFKKVKAAGCNCFDNFEDMMYALYEKLYYHLMYREISPKIIEHFLEGYTIHPYLPYTCDLWNTKGESK